LVLALHVDRRKQETDIENKSLGVRCQAVIVKVRAALSRLEQSILRVWMVLVDALRERSIGSMRDLLA
jgi:hypothetical protein